MFQVKFIDVREITLNMLSVIQFCLLLFTMFHHLPVNF